MNSIKEYVNESYQKDLISQLLKQAFTNISESEYEELTEMISTKLLVLNNLRDMMNKNSNDELEAAAKSFGVEKENVISTFLYFSLVVENTILTKQIGDLLCQIEKLKNT
jgi:hypothetical protein